LPLFDNNRFFSPIIFMHCSIEKSRNLKVSEGIFAPDLEKRQFKIKNCACVIFHIRFYFDPLKLEKVCTESVELNGIMCTLRLKSTYIDPHSCFHFQTQKSIIVHILNDTCFVNCWCKNICDYYHENKISLMAIC
jgi:hypothetical protein